MEWEKRGMPIEYWWGSQKKGDHLEDQDISEWMSLKWMLQR
jgi:predicted lipoprotein with Yx(FWY)xxD motif